MRLRVPRRGSLHLRLLLLAAVVIAITAALTALQIVSDRERSIEAAYRDSEKLAKSLEEHAAATFENAQGLASIIAQRIATAGGLDKMAPGTLAAMLREEIMGVRSVVSIVVTRPDFTVFAHSYPAGTNLPERLDQPHFRYIRDHPDYPGIRIGDPFPSSLNGQWLLPVTAGILNASGQLTGITSVALELDYFRRFYESLGLDPGSVLVLAKRSGETLVRQPAVASAIGKVGPVMVQALMLLELASTARLHSMSGVDGQERFHAFRLTENPPLIAMVGESAGTVLAPWRERTQRVAALATLVLLMFLTLMGYLVRQAHRLEQSEQRFNLAARGAGVGIWTYDLASGDLYLSPEWLANIGFRPGELPLEHTFTLPLIHPDDMPAFESFYEKLKARDNRLQIDLECRIRHKDGSYRWFLNRGQVVNELNGEALRIAGSTVDIHQLKTAEEALNRLNAELELRVAERTRALELANRDLESFSYSVAHDLRAPVRHLNGYLDLLKEALGPAVNDQTRTFTEKMKKAIHRMDELIRDMLALAQLSRKQMMIGRVDLSALARAAIDAFREAQPERMVEAVIAPDLVCEGDPGLLRVVIDNLIGNAWKYSRHQPEARIEFGQTDTPRGRACFVRDNGAGFDMKYADKLFQPFQRLHNASEFEGNGVGLATVQRIVARHGGTVWAEATPGQGAVFYFHLPSCPAAHQNDRPVREIAG